jgi:fatty acid desaturase
MQGGPPNTSQVEWPTAVVGIAVYGAWLALLHYHQHLPVAVLIGLLALLGALFGSFQHEAIHGHPFRDRRFGDLAASPPLALWLPYSSYRETHLRHHRSALTDPGDDPESWYCDEATWAEASRAKRAVLIVLRTLGGRLLLGPFVNVARFWRDEASAIADGDGTRALVWLRHVVACAVVITAVTFVFGVPFWQYALGFCFGGLSLTMLRSFAEHRAVVDGTPSAVVEAGWFFSALFLNNNLHHTHHALPGAAWYRLPQLHRDIEGSATAHEGAGLYSGYLDVVFRHLWRPFCQPVHPHLTADREA